MKYDPDIALQILKAIEAHDRAELPMKTYLLPELDIEKYYYHCRLLSEAGYISAYRVGTSGPITHYWPRELKWDGVQFLQMFKNETLWQRAKNEATSKGVGTALETLMEVGANIATRLITSQTGLG